VIPDKLDYQSQPLYFCGKKMRYTITKDTLDFNDHIDITETKYFEIKNSANNLIEAVLIEEKFDILIENYFEYEMTLLNSSLHNLLYSLDKDYLMDARSQITRRIINFLSTCRMYLDHSKHHLSNIYGKESKIFKKFNEKISIEYDSKLSYRIIEAMRNYAQHRGYPIYGIMLEGKLLDGDIKKDRLYSTTPYLIPSEFENDEKFNKSVYEEMKKFSKKIDLKMVVRDYIESLGSIHQKLRELLKKDIEVWDKSIFEVVDIFKMKFGENITRIGLVIANLDSKGKFKEYVNINKDLSDRREKFELKNRNLKNLKERIVTSKAS